MILPIKHGVFSIAMLVYQRVLSPLSVIQKNVGGASVALLAFDTAEAPAAGRTQRRRHNSEGTSVVFHKFLEILNLLLKHVIHWESSSIFLSTPNLFETTNQCFFPVFYISKNCPPDPWG